MNTTDFIKKAEMVETHDGLKLYVVRNNASTDPKAVLIILHGLANDTLFMMPSCSPSTSRTSTSIATMPADMEGQRASEAM